MKRQTTGQMLTSRLALVWCCASALGGCAVLDAQNAGKLAWPQTRPASADAAESPAVPAPAPATVPTWPITPTPQVPERWPKMDPGPETLPGTDPTQFASLYPRIAAAMALPPLGLVGDAASERYAQHFARTGLLKQAQTNAALCLHHFVVEAQRRNLPSELALLPFIESAYNPKAHSSANAVGICQFIPATGKRFALWQSVYVDMRRDAVRCADAMYSYLAENHARFNDWHLALAAYNAGEGAVGKAMEANRRRGLGVDFDALALPKETRNYVPALLGLARLVANPERYGVVLPVIANQSVWRSVRLPADADVDKLTRMAGVEPNTFRLLNPALNKLVVPRAAQPDVNLPHAAADRLQSALENIAPAGLSSWVSTVVKSSTRLDKIAHQMGTSEAALRSVNHIPHNHSTVLAGSTLTVPKPAGSELQITALAAQSAVLMTQAPATRKTAKTRRKFAKPSKNPRR